VIDGTPLHGAGRQLDFALPVAHPQGVGIAQLGLGQCPVHVDLDERQVGLGSFPMLEFLS
jgi:hypothetical protein